MGIILNLEHKENIVLVDRKNERIMSARLIIDKKIVNLEILYTPQIDREDKERDKFCQDINSTRLSITDYEYTMVAKDFNGDVEI